MKIEVNKKAFLELFLCFCACAVVNLVIHPAPDLYIIGDTAVVAFPYLIAVLYYLVVKFKQDKVIYIYTHRVFIIVMIIMEIFVYPYFSVLMSS
jgi:hypothetical protein